MKKIYFLIHVFFLLCGNFLFVLQTKAQLLIPETLYAHFDKSFYIAGEDMWYSVYFMTPELQKSQIMHVELIGPDGKQLIKQMLRCSKARAAGDLALSPDWPTGYYLFRAYTSWNLNFSPQEIYERYIPIYNANADIDFIYASETIDYETNPTKGISIKLSENTYNPRDTIQIDLSGQGHFEGGASASLSVIDLSYAENISAGENIMERYETVNNARLNTLKVGEQQLDPEINYQKTFVLKSPKTDEYVNSNFIVGFIRQTRQKLIHVSEQGIVTFTFNDFYDSTLVQIFDANPFKRTVIPEVSEIFTSISVSPPQMRDDTPPLFPQVAQYIKQYRKYFQVDKMFGSRSNMRAKRTEPLPATIVPTNIYKVDDYVPHESMQDFVLNAIPPVKLKWKKSSRTGEKTIPEFKLYIPHKANREKFVVEKSPLLMVNDYFTYDAQAVLKMDWDNIQQIDVYNSPEKLPIQFGPIGDFGVIAFHTKDGQTPESIKATANKLFIPGFYRPREFVQLSADESISRQSKVPNFRPLIYWNPNLEINGSETQTYSFLANDQPGKYLVKVEGVTTTGVPFASEQIFELVIRR